MKEKKKMNKQPANSLRQGPDENGKFGIFGGRFVAETLMPLILDLEKSYRAAQKDPEFLAEMDDLRTHFAGRPSPLYFAERMSAELGGARVYFKREDLNHTGSHKINNCRPIAGRRMGKTRIIAETGAGQHGSRPPRSARFGLPCTVFMGATDVERQMPNVLREDTGRRGPVTAGADLRTP